MTSDSLWRAFGLSICWALLLAASGGATAPACASAWSSFDPLGIPYEARLRQLEKDREALDALLRRMNTELVGIELEATKTPFADARGALPWPAEWQIRQRFGTQRSRGALRWQGVVIAAAPGSPVHAVHAGRVVYADWLRGSGLLVIVDHGDGFMTLYAHNEELTRTTGEWIQAGDETALRAVLLEVTWLLSKESPTRLPAATPVYPLPLTRHPVTRWPLPARVSPL